MSEPDDGMDQDGGQPQGRRKPGMRWRLYREPKDPPRRFGVESPEDLLASFKAEVSEELLAEAEKLYAEPHARVESVERRATTLLSSVAIAASVALTGGGLALDQVKIAESGWRVAFTLCLAALVGTLVATGLRAHAASARAAAFRAPSDSDEILERAALTDVDQYRRRRAAYLLWAYGRNDEAARVKIWYLWRAAFWFRIALIALAITATVMVAYVVTGHPRPTRQAGTTGANRGAKWGRTHW